MAMIGHNRVTRHVSLDNEYVLKMKPYIEKYECNFSSALREIIDTVKGLVLSNEPLMVNRNLFD